jgi:hypothetical protein
VFSVDIGQLKANIYLKDRLFNAGSFKVSTGRARTLGCIGIENFIEKTTSLPPTRALKSEGYSTP